MIYLLIGLGNPGTKYSGNRHNIGFMAIDRMMSDYGFSKTSLKFGGSLSEGIIDGNKVFAFKPLSYMNVSGQPVGEMARFYKIPLENTIVIHDELDLPLGKLRVKKGGGSGGHNGLKSLDAHLGTDYVRIRIGIDRPEHKDMVSHYVLSDFRKEEIPTAEHTIEKISDNIGVLIAGNESEFMNKVATESQSPSNNTIRN